MEKQQFKVSIDAPREKVWSILWNDATYREWTSAFMEGSKAETEGSKAVTDWKKGSKVLFLSASNEGMVSRIEENIPNEFMSFKHLGVVKDGVEDIGGEKAKEWAGSLENYTLKNVNGRTELTVDIDVSDEYKDYFQTTFPKALDKVKELAEKSKVAATSNA